MGVIIIVVVIIVSVLVAVVFGTHKVYVVSQAWNSFTANCLPG